MDSSGHVIVIGAGISGLTAAWWLRRNGVTVTVLEKEVWVGGTMRTLSEEGWLVETGPNSALETTPLFGQMFEELGIAHERVYAHPSSNKRYIVRDGRLHVLPMSPQAFLTSSLWSMKGKLRLLKEPLVGRAQQEETIAQFVERRLGREFLDYAINPFVAGVYAGNPEELSVRAAFPKLYSLEEKYGGLIKGMIKGRKERKRRSETTKDRAKMFSFAKGMQTFPLAIAGRLGDRLLLGCEVTSITEDHVDGEKSDRVFHVRYLSGDVPSSMTGDAIVFAAPAYATSMLIQPLSSGLAATLERIYYPPVAEVYLGFRSEQFTMPLDGFGYLIPAKEGRQILGTIWSSSLFPDRAPEGHVALTTFVGGARQPHLVQSSDRELTDVVMKELRSLMGAQGEPVFSRVIRWNKAIPQYNLGYHRVTEEIERLETQEPGIFFCSNYRGGISVGDCVMSAERMAARIDDYLRKRSIPHTSLKDP